VGVGVHPARSLRCWCWIGWLTLRVGLARGLRIRAFCAHK
jgi:hypothetical protein